MSRRYTDVEDQRRRRHRILIYVILATLPCYFCGITLLVGFSGSGGSPTPTMTAALTETATLTETPTGTVTRTPTNTPGGPTLTLARTPTQFTPPTRTGTPDLDATATIRALLTQGANSLTATAVAPTQRAQATGTARVEATQTAQAGATLTAQANATATANANASATANANATATANANATATARANATANANQPPTANDDSATTNQGQAVTVNVLANDSDPNGDTLSFSSFNQTSAQGGTVNCTGTSCTYTPAASFSGTDTFNYTISDGRGGTDSATVTITVNEAPNQPPDANNDTATTTRGTAVSVNVLANDSDPDGDSLNIIDWDNTSDQDGVVACTGATCMYTPPGAFTGTDTFTYTINDGRGGEDTATVTVTINAP